MNKVVSVILSILCFVASFVMYKIGSTSSHLTELLDFFWMPLPLGIILMLLGIKANKPGSV